MKKIILRERNLKKIARKFKKTGGPYTREELLRKNYSVQSMSPVLRFALVFTGVALAAISVSVIAEDGLKGPGDALAFAVFSLTSLGLSLLGIVGIRRKIRKIIGRPNVIIKGSSKDKKKEHDEYDIEDAAEHVEDVIDAAVETLDSDSADIFTAGDGAEGLSEAAPGAADLTEGVADSLAGAVDAAGGAADIAEGAADVLGSAADIASGAGEVLGAVTDGLDVLGIILGFLDF